MRECEAFFAAHWRVTELMEAIRVLVRDERGYAERDESSPAEREAEFLEKNRALEQAMREVGEEFRTVEKCGAERERNEARRMVEILRENFRETMRLVEDTQAVIQRARDETFREIRAMGLKENAIRAYGSGRKT